MVAKMGRRSVRCWIALGLACAFIALAVSVRLGMLNDYDSTVREWARPDDVWGATQVRASYVVKLLHPLIPAALLALFTAIIAVLRGLCGPPCSCSVSAW
jgi:uncharacterized membrane protein YdjX (TVP38/TMEM64 family)